MKFMKNMIIEIKDKSCYITNFNKLIVDKQKLDMVKEYLLNKDYLQSLEQNIYNNEVSQLDSFNQFTDLDMLYYYINRKTHDDDKKNKKQNTKIEYVRDLLQFLHYLSFLLINEEKEGTSVLKQIEKRHIRLYQKWLSEFEFRKGKKGYAVATRSRKIIIVKGFLRWLYEKEYIQRPLHMEFIKVSVQNHELPNRSFTHEEVKQLIQYYRNHPINHAILVFLASTGLRINEVATAKWSDIYFDQSVNGGAYFLKVLGKGSKYRHVYLPNTVLDSLKRMRRRRKLNDRLDVEDKLPIFVTNKLKPYSSKYLSNYVIKMIKDTKFDWLKDKESDISPHWFRHYFITHLIVDRGVNIVKVQKTVGHQSIRTTERYVDQFLANKDNAGLLLDEEDYL